MVCKVMHIKISIPKYQKKFSTYCTVVKLCTFLPPEPAHHLQTACFFERKTKPQGTVLICHQWRINVKIMNTHRGNISGGKLIVFNSGHGQQSPLCNIDSSV